MKTSVTSTVSFTEIHHLARLNWEQDGCPEGLDMEYYLAAESLLVTVRPHGLFPENKTTATSKENEAAVRQVTARRAGHALGNMRSARKSATASAHASFGKSGERIAL